MPLPAERPVTSNVVLCWPAGMLTLAALRLNTSGAREEILRTSSTAFSSEGRVTVTMRLSPTTVETEPGEKLSDGSLITTVRLVLNEPTPVSMMPVPVERP